MTTKRIEEASTLKVLVLSGPNHRFEDSASVINDFLGARGDMSVELTDDKGVLASSQLDEFDVCVFGTGFTRTVSQPDGTPKREPDLTSEQEDGLFQFVSGGKGLVGIHGTAWWIGGRAVDLIGGHANWHPPGGTFTVKLTTQITRLHRALGTLRSRTRSICPLMIPTSISLRPRNGQRNNTRWHG